MKMEFFTILKQLSLMLALSAPLLGWTNTATAEAATPKDCQIKCDLSYNNCISHGPINTSGNSICLAPHKWCKSCCTGLGDHVTTDAIDVCVRNAGMPY